MRPLHRKPEGDPTHSPINRGLIVLPATSAIWYDISWTRSYQRIERPTMVAARRVRPGRRGGSKRERESLVDHRHQLVRINPENFIKSIDGHYLQWIASASGLIHTLGNRRMEPPTSDRR